MYLALKDTHTLQTHVITVHGVKSLLRIAQSVHNLPGACNGHGDVVVFLELAVVGGVAFCSLLHLLGVFAAPHVCEVIIVCGCGVGVGVGGVLDA